MGRPGASDITRRLAEICGSSFARLAGPADEVAGRPARWVAVPGDAQAAGHVLRLAADHELAVVPRGAGTKIDWGAAPDRVDIVLDTGRLAGFGHRPDDAPEVEVGAGTPMRAVQARLGRGGQWLPLDPPSPGATLGGVIAANEPGPLRHRHGGPASHLVRLRYLDADGELATVPVDGAAAAGVDPVRLLCGSQGGLGLLVAATLRVQAVPACRYWVTCPVRHPAEARDLVQVVTTADVDPAAIEADLPAAPALSPFVHPAHPSVAGRGVWTGSLVVLLEGDPADVAERARQLTALLGPTASGAFQPPPWWGRYPFGPGDVALRIEAPPDHLHSPLYVLQDVARAVYPEASGVPVPARGSLAAGVLYAALAGPLAAGERVTRIVDSLRQTLQPRGGRCVVVAAPPQVRAAVDFRAGVPVPAGLPEAKERVDPHRRLAPGRLPGGL
ncbi:FAD-binding oxidoreductase [Micromonospora rosaria]|nr:FAD-binding oxidoreductase [Micromonospora rosaria]